MPLPSRVSESVRRLNPQLFGPAPSTAIIWAAPVVGVAKEAPRIRQARTPKLNKTEADFLDHLRAKYPRATVLPHGMTLLIANGCRYTPDFYLEFEGGDGRPALYEVKGKKAWDDAIVKLKVAAARFQAFDFWLVDRLPRTGWRTARVYP